MVIEAHTKLRRWTVDEYAHLIGEGFFEGERLELIDGEILEMSPQHPNHRNAIAFLNTFFVRTFGETHLVQVQLPLNIGKHSEPEPDFSFVTPKAIKEAKRHPTQPDLVLEISDSSLKFDTGKKASLYASAQIPEYWVLNLTELCLEVYTDPKKNERSEFGWLYSKSRTLVSGEVVQPVVLGPTVTVDQLFDWPRS